MRLFWKCIKKFIKYVIGNIKQNINEKEIIKTYCYYDLNNFLNFLNFVTTIMLNILEESLKEILNTKYITLYYTKEINLIVKHILRISENKKLISKLKEKMSYKLTQFSEYMYFIFDNYTNFLVLTDMIPIYYNKCNKGIVNVYFKIYRISCKIAYEKIFKRYK